MASIGSCFGNRSLDNLFLDLRLISFNHSMNSSVYIVTDSLNHSVDQLVGLSVDQ